MHSQPCERADDPDQRGLPRCESRRASPIAASLRETNMSVQRMDFSMGAKRWPFMRGWTTSVALIAATVGMTNIQAADMPVKAPMMESPPPAGEIFWAEAGYLYWQTKGDPVPALATTGVLDAPGTVTLFGNSTVNQDWRSGLRLRAGYWFDPRRITGIETHFFGLEDTSAGVTAVSSGAPVLARPFFNTVINAPDALLIASPDVTSGQLSATNESQLLGAGIAFRKELCADCAMGPVSGIVGYRYLRLRDDLAISSLQNTVTFPATIGVTDQFETHNDFHGLDLGVTGQIASGLWMFEWLAKVALGATLTDISVSGVTAITAGGTTTTAAGGLLALPTNSGSFSDQQFSVVPELNVRVVYQFTPKLRAFAGYDFIYWTDVVRPGGVIDTVVNPTQLPPGTLAGAARPAPRADTSDYWAHGVSLGLAFSF
jgi:hypothetical protein